MLEVYGNKPCFGNPWAGVAAPPPPLSLSAGARLAVIGDSIDAGPTTDGFLEAIAQQFYIPALNLSTFTFQGVDVVAAGAAAGYTGTWNFAIAGTEVVHKSQTQDFASYQVPMMIAVLQAVGQAPGVVLLGGYENSITHGDTAANILAGYQSCIAQIAAAFPSAAILLRKMAASWVTIADDGATKVATAATVSASLDALAMVTPNLRIINTDAYDHAAAGWGYNIASGTKAAGSNHPNTSYGAPKYGQIMAASVLPLINTPDTSLFAPSGALPQNQELNPAWDMPGTGGTIASGGSGLLANNCVWTNTSDHLATLSKGTMASGSTSQNISFNGLATVKGAFRNLLTIVPNQPLRAGQVYTIDIELEISDNAGTGDAVGLYGLGINNTAGVSIGSVYPVTAGGPIWPNTGAPVGAVSANALKRSIWLRTESKVLSADLTSVQIALDGLTDARALDILIKQGRTHLRIAKSDPINRVLTLQNVVGGPEGSGGNTTKTITVTRPHTVGTVNVPFVVTGTGANPLDAADFVGGVLPSGTVQVAAGSSSGFATFQISGDTGIEPDETGLVTISNPGSAYTLGTATSTFTVVDDDGVTYDTDASTLFARMTVQPTTAKKAAISAFIAGAKTDGFWSRLHYFRCHGLHDMQSAMLNWTNTTAYDGTVGGTLTHTPGIGITGDGSTGYIDTHYASPTANQNDAHIGLWSLSSGQFGNPAMGNSTSWIQPRSTSDTATLRMNGGVVSQTVASVTDGTGHIVQVRALATGAGSHLDYRNGTLRTSINRTSATPDTSSYREFGKSNTAAFWGGQLFCAHAGAALTSGDVANLTARLTTLKAALV